MMSTSPGEFLNFTETRLRERRAQRAEDANGPRMVCSILTTAPPETPWSMQILRRRTVGAARAHASCMLARADWSDPGKGFGAKQSSMDSRRSRAEADIGRK